MRPGIVTTLLIIAACCVPEYGHAATHARAPFAGPTATCNFEHRMEIQVIDGIWFECMCLALATGWDCAWVELPEPVVANLKRRIKNHTLHRRIIFVYAKPSVVA